MAFQFVLNGSLVSVGDLPARTTLADYLRSSGLTGTKIGCAEGDCGACTVALLDRDAHGQPTYRAINSCIALLPMFADREIVTVEGLSAEGEPLHPVQQAMVENYGSQCGYCTPGFVVSMFEGYHRDNLDSSALSDQLCGNLCRCTGYRPIRDAALDAVCRRPQPIDPHQRRLEGSLSPLGDLRHETASDRFYRPTNLDDLFQLLAEHPDARLVAGATEIGVEINKKSAHFPTLISTEAVPALGAIHRAPDSWWIGGAASLTAIEETVAKEIPALHKMLRVFASRQIRSRATLGGNLATASPIGDSAPLLLALDARLHLTSARESRTVALEDFFLAYRKTALHPGEIVFGIEVPHAPDAASGLSRRADFLKVSKRRELDISIVAAAFVVDLDGNGVVRRARLAYGGVAATPVRARRAEEALLGTKWSEALAEVSAILAAEFQPIDDVRGHAAYRRNLVVSLFEKFVRGETSVAIDGPLAFEHGEPWAIDDPSRALPHESAVGHVTGRALYADDVAQRRGSHATGMLDAWPVVSPHARARIRRRDAARARTMPGVRAVLFAEDIPGDNNVGPARHDEPLLATDEVFYQGQLIALVVGDSLAECRDAAAAVAIDFEPLPPMLGIEAAIAGSSFHTEPHQLARGDVEAALAAAPFTFTGTFAFGGQEHFYLETQAAWAEPSPEGGEDGSILVSSSTQHPAEIQAMVAHVLGLERHQVVSRSTRMGGGFGGKETQGNAIAALVALAAQRTRRAVRIQLDRDLDMAITGKRHPFQASFRVGHDAAGRLLAVEVDLTSDGGWSLDLSQAILDRALFHLDNAYYLPACRFRGRVAKTHVASNTAFRGFGGPQGMLVIEEILDRVARRTSLAPEVVRERNLYRVDPTTSGANVTHYGVDLGDDRIGQVWRRVLEQADFAARRRAIDEWNRTHPSVKRGLAATPVKFGISFTMTHFNQGGALVLLYVDGTAQVNHGGTEMGQGLHTKIRGIVMRELGLSEEAVRVMPTTTEKVPNTSATAASAGSDLNGAAVADACHTLRERLAPIAATLRAERPGEEFSFADLCRRAHRERVSLAATGYYSTPDIHWSWDVEPGAQSPLGGRPFYYYVPAAAVSEVEIDGFTGMHRVLRVDIVEDVGDSLNPGVDRGQIEGGFVQGMGWLTREELLWNEHGHLLTHSASTYAIPAISDAPLDFRITLLPGATQPGVVHGSKAVGEPPLMLAISVREAIRDAVAAFGPAGGEVALPSPATCEAIYEAIRARRG